MLERFFRELSILAFDFLEANHVWLFLGHKGFDVWQTEPDRVDIPASDLERVFGHMVRLGSAMHMVNAASERFRLFAEAQAFQLA